MASRARLLLIALAATTAPFTLNAQAPAPKADPRVELAAKIPGAKPDELRQSPIPGIWELARGTDIAYVTADGKYVLAGDLYDLASNDNLTETRRRGERLRLLKGVPESDMLVFGPRDSKYTITVFTDVDCSYCRKLHSEMADYNRLGIKVRYLFYPRSGPDTESWHKAEEVWCSANRNEALTKAKRGEDLKNVKSCPTPVARDYQLGQDFAIRGTPAIILADGEVLPGYVPPASLAEHLRTSQKSAKK
jgi:thiol:disulfide interchange protein DsbC